MQYEWIIDVVIEGKLEQKKCFSSDWIDPLDFEKYLRDILNYQKVEVIGIRRGRQV